MGDAIQDRKDRRARQGVLIASSLAIKRGEAQVAVPGLLAGNHQLVEAGGQYIHGFRRGLDYPFIRPLMERMDAERVIPLIESAGS